jgi:hypothetical protein
MTYREAQLALMRIDGVVSVGWGSKITGGKTTGVPSIVVGVERKLPKNKVPKSDLIPAKLDTFPTDVVETGAIKAQEFRQERHRPAMPGISIGHPSITAGTFGAVVYDESDQKLILSNNHVLAASNKGNIGDDIYQPGVHDTGSSVDKIGILADYVPIELREGGSLPSCPFAKKAAAVANAAAKAGKRKHRLKAYIPEEAGEPNLVDAAVCLPDNENDVTPEIFEIGFPKSEIKRATVGMALQKSGRTTGYTTGTVMQVDAMANVNYGDGMLATFENQIITGPMSAGGDSGSLVLDMENHPVGLLFAGSNQVTILNSIDNVLELLKVHF